MDIKSWEERFFYSFIGREIKFKSVFSFSFLFIWAVSSILLTPMTIISAYDNDKINGVGSFVLVFFVAMIMPVIPSIAAGTISALVSYWLLDKDKNLQPIKVILIVSSIAFCFMASIVLHF